MKVDLHNRLYFKKINSIEIKKGNLDLKKNKVDLLQIKVDFAYQLFLNFIVI